MSDKQQIFSNDPTETTIPATIETFEAQVVTFSREHTETTYPLTPQFRQPMQETQRIVTSKRYRLEFVPSHIAYGKPTILLYEEEENK